MSAPRRIRSSTSSTLRGSGSPVGFALDWRIGTLTLASLASFSPSFGTRRPRRPGSAPQASGKRVTGFGTSTVTGPGSSRASASLVFGPISGSSANARS
jgi:hypothetical protein